MPEINILREIEILIRSHYGLIFIETNETDRAEEYIKQLRNYLNTKLIIWTPAKGLYESGLKNVIYKTRDAHKVLEHITQLPPDNIYLLNQYTSYLKDKVIVSEMFDVIKRFSKSRGALILTGSVLEIPELLFSYTAKIMLPLPDKEEFEKLMKKVYNEVTNTMDMTVEISKDELNLLINNLKGFTREQAKRFLFKIMIDDGKLTFDDIRSVIKEKKSIIEKEGVLEYFTVDERFEDIADLYGLKDWLNKRKRFITEPEAAKAAGLTFPKGILLLGVPGTGKSLSAKAVSMEWGLPLLKLESSLIYDKYIGETEKKFKLALTTAERMSPLVLWIDEIEKFFTSGSENDSGVSNRIMGTFLSWLQEREGNVFVVATANNISGIPSELLRKGRFDEIFFVDLPEMDIRKEIFKIHLKKRGYGNAMIDVDYLAAETDGFSGAEIEQLIVSALYTAFSYDRKLSIQILHDEIKNTSPLSKMRAEQITYLRNWAKGRTAKAN